MSSDEVRRWPSHLLWSLLLNPNPTPLACACSHLGWNNIVRINFFLVGHRLAGAETTTTILSRFFSPRSDTSSRPRSFTLSSWVESSSYLPLCTPELASSTSTPVKVSSRLSSSHSVTPGLNSRCHLAAFAKMVNRGDALESDEWRDSPIEKQWAWLIPTEVSSLSSRVSPFLALREAHSTRLLSHPAYDGPRPDPTNSSSHDYRRLSSPPRPPRFARDRQRRMGSRALLPSRNEPARNPQRRLRQRHLASRPNACRVGRGGCERQERGVGEEDPGGDGGQGRRGVGHDQDGCGQG